MIAIEANFDGLVGPTHNYAGLSEGNLASLGNRTLISSPKTAALQGLAKMRAMLDLGMVQGVLPPHARPNIKLLRQLGFSGSDRSVWEQAWKESSALALNAASASSMWVANAGTLSAAADTPDRRNHFTPANLVSMFHRSSEAGQTGFVLQRIFADPQHFQHHPALPGCAQLGDEGAANHTRLTGAYGQAGVSLFVYGADSFDRAAAVPKRYPARQTLQASRAVARQHGLGEDQCVFAQQHPDAIDAGVFHNDVIAVGNLNVLFYHQQAFLDTNAVLDELRRKLAPTELVAIEVPAGKVSLQDAVQSYLFNTQLIQPPNSAAATLIAPTECQSNPAVQSYLQSLERNNPAIGEVVYFNLRESMRNGGGPACLRLRVPLNQAQLAAVAPGVMLNGARIGALESWVTKHYRDRLSGDDLRDPSIIDETRTALDELSRILELGNIYEFQQ